MKTRDRLLAVDSSAPHWRKGVPEFPVHDVTLMRLIRVASLSFTACTDPLLHPTGLTESSYHTLIVVTASGAQGTTPTALCEQLGQNRANMTRILDVLASEQLVEVNADVRDARRRRIVVTASGRKLVRTYAGKLAPLIETAFASLSTGEKETFERLLRKIIDSLDTAESMLAKTA